MKTTLCGITLSILLAVNARAELKWDQTTIELHPTPSDKQAIAHFKYENVGKTAVHFKSVHASCGCTTAQSQQDVVNPGDKGEITATFNIGGRTGTQVKQVTVNTDDPNASVTTLTLKAIIPQMMSINPTFVFWKNGEKPAAKTIALKASPEFPVKDIKVTSSSTDFTTKVEPAGKSEWKLTVQPKSTDKALTGMLTILPETPDKPAQPFYANVSVTAPPATPPPAKQ